MTISEWEAGKIYLPGATVGKRTVPANIIGDIENSDFGSGDTGWTKVNDFTIQTVDSFVGLWSAVLNTNSSIYSTLENDTYSDISPGQSVNVKCNATGSIDTNASLGFKFYDSSFVLILTNETSVSIHADIWEDFSHEVVAPVDAAYVRVQVSSNSTTGIVKFDNFSWNLSSSNGISGLIFKAVQSASGISGSDEPIWPIVAGNTVVDNEVTWEAVEASIVTWEARPILTSGATEPAWPTVSGAVISDNDISWLTVPLHIEDENCPHTREVAIGASKIFAGDYDITRFSATLNPRDWTTQEDAGFLSSGLHQGEQVGVTALGVYRGNLAIWSDSSFQVWQIDPDPSAMALLDAMEGIGSAHHKAVQPVSNDLFFLAALGIRTVGVAAGSTNLAAGDAGVPIDTLIQVEIDDTIDPIATYYPSAGQYWLAFPPYVPSEPGPIYPDTDPDTDPDQDPITDCNDIYGIGTLTPDLHLAGTQAGDVFEGNMIIGTGIVQDESLDTVMTTNQTGDYDSWPGFNPGIQDGLAQVYYNECQWYNYAGPVIFNTMPGSTYDLTTAGWGASGTGTVAADQPGLIGTINNSSTLTDSGVDSYGVSRTSSVNQIVANGDPFTSRFVVHKETSAAHWALLICTINDAPNRQMKVLFNAQTGTANIAASSTGNNKIVDVRDNGNWWEVYIQFDAESTVGGTTEAILDIRPAANTDGTDSIVNATSGSIRIGETGIYESGMTIGQLRGSAAQPMGAAAGSSVINISKVYIDLINHDDTEGGYFIEWRPLYDDTEITRNIEILSLNDAPGLLYYDYSTNLLTATDGTNIATAPLALVANKKYRLGVIFGDYLMVGVNSEWGSSVSYDGSFPALTDFVICRNPEAVNYWRELRGFQVPVDTAKVEINLLMNGQGVGYSDPEAPEEVTLPYWDNLTNTGWIDLTKTTIQSFFETFSTTIESDDFEDTFAIGGSLTPIATLINTIDGGNQVSFIDDVAYARAIMFLVDASGNVFDYVEYNNVTNAEFITIPTGANYYLVTASDTGNAVIKKFDSTEDTTPVSLEGSTPYLTFFGVEFLDGTLDDETRVIPAEGAFIAFTVPITSDVYHGIFSTIENTAISTTRSGSLNRTVGDFNTEPTYVWGIGGGIHYNINDPGYGGIDLIQGQTYIFNVKNDSPTAANWIRIQHVAVKQ